MVDWLKQFLAPPVFEDPDKSRVAGLLNVVLLILLAVTVLGTAAVLPLEPGEVVFNLTFGVILTASILGLRALVRRGHLGFVSSVLSLILWVSITVLVFMGKGIRDPSVSGYFLVIAVASLLLGGRGALVFGGLSIVALAGMFFAEQRGVITPDVAASADIVQLMMVVLVLGMVVVVLRSAMSRLGDALERARADEQAMERINENLRANQEALTERTRALERRSRYLQSSAEVGRAVTSILETDHLIRQVVDLIRDRFNLYYVGLFVLDEEGEWAVLRAGTGEAGRAMLDRGHRIRVGTGMIGWSIAHAQARVAHDVGEDAVRLATPELPATRSEGALPLRSRGRVLGALTVQSVDPGAFDEDTVVVLQTMADQVGVALDNARLFAESRRALEAVRRAYGEISRKAWAEVISQRLDLGYLSDPQGVRSVEDAWRPEMVQALQEGELVQPEEDTVTIPVRVHDAVIGAVRLRKEDGAEGWTGEEMEMVQELADQLAVALESARLYQDTQRSALSERLVSEVSTRIRESLDVETVLRTSADEIYRVLDLEEVVVRLAGNGSSQ